MVGTNPTRSLPDRNDAPSLRISSLLDRVFMIRLFQVHRVVILDATLHLADLADQVFPLFRGLNKVDIVGLDDQNRRLGITKEELVVAFNEGMKVFRGNLFFVVSSYLLDSLKQYFGVGLKIDYQVKPGNSSRQKVEDLLVKIKLFIVQVQGRENSVFCEKIIRNGVF